PATGRHLVDVLQKSAPRNDSNEAASIKSPPYQLAGFFRSRPTLPSPSLLCDLCVLISVNSVLPSLFSFFSSAQSSSHAATRMPYMDFPRCPARSTRSVLYSCKT